MRVEGFDKVYAIADEDMDRENETTTSSVHFVRFQLQPGAEANDLVLHVKMLDNDTQLQQQAVGMVGRLLATLLYGGFGVGAFVLVALGLYSTLLKLARRDLRAPLLRVSGGVLVLVGGFVVLTQLGGHDDGGPQDRCDTVTSSNRMSTPPMRCSTRTSSW